MIAARFMGWVCAFPHIFKKTEIPEQKRGVTFDGAPDIVRQMAKDTRVIGDGSIEFRLGSIEGLIHGGPYRRKPEDLHGIKMDAEIDLPCTVDIPTEDFSTPDPEALRLGMMATLALLKSHGQVYVGCMGGIGRTGLLMAAMAKLMCEGGGLPTEGGFRPRTLGDPIPDSIRYVRHHYKPHAVETKAQINLIKELRVDDLVRIAKSL